jgi:hypothetical protein
MNWNVYEKKESWPIFGYSPGYFPGSPDVFKDISSREYPLIISRFNFKLEF